MAGAKFPKTCRLKSSSEFRAVMDRRVRLSDNLLAIYLAANGLGGASRLGISVSRASGGAVRRNTIKRLMREVWRNRQGQMPQGYDYVMMITKKSQCRLPTYKELDDSFVGLMAKFRAAQEQE
jgi:ribonuclease P protein component